MSYEIALTEAEYNALGWLTDRGYFPKETWLDLVPTGSVSGSEEVYKISESAAWAILDMAEEDPHALFTCAAEPLLSKLLKLEASIV